LAPLDEAVLNPGDSTQLEMIFFTRRYSGGITRKARITTNESEERCLHYVTIHTDVYENADSLFPVILKPDIWNFTPLDNPPVDLILFEIENVSNQDIGIYPFDYPEEMIEISLTQFVGANSTGGGYIKINQDYVDKSFTESVTIKFTDSAQTRITIPVIHQLRTP
jgi:hypothetical protein